VNVRVVTPAGTSAVSLADIFVYVEPSPPAGGAGGRPHPAPPLPPVPRTPVPAPPVGVGPRPPPPGQP
jgi:hypothetical protein